MQSSRLQIHIIDKFDDSSQKTDDGDSYDYFAFIVSPAENLSIFKGLVEVIRISICVNVLIENFKTLKTRFLKLIEDIRILSFLLLDFFIENCLLSLNLALYLLKFAF